MFVWSRYPSQEADLLLKVKAWFNKGLGCVIGKREFALSRYMIALVANREDWLEAHRIFVQRVGRHEVSACLYIPVDIAATSGLDSVVKVVDYLSATFLNGLKRPQDENFASKLHLLCPVTNVEVLWPDFDLVAFYPQAMRKSDLLYDPSNGAPFVCMNQASDMFGFALMCRDLCRVTYRCQPYELQDRAQLEDMLRRAAVKWQELARKTIVNFGSRTDPAYLTPAHVSANENFYVTQHDEAAFGEQEKLEHYSEMPKLYLDRLIAEWMRFFDAGDRPRLDHVVRPSLCPVKIKDAALACPFARGPRANENLFSPPEQRTELQLA